MADESSHVLGCVEANDYLSGESLHGNIWLIGTFHHTGTL